MSDPIGTIERILGDAESLPDPRARALTKALAAALVELAGTGLARAIELGDPALLRKLADDPVAGSLLVLCGMHPDSAGERARTALAAATKQLGRCGVALARVDDGIRVVLSAERGTPIDEARVRSVVEDIVLARAPDAESVQIELDGRLLAAPGFVPVERLRVMT